MKKDKYSGSITVESALVLPLFIFVVLFFCFFFRMMELEFTMQKALNHTVKELASYGYVLNRAETLTEEKKTELLSSVVFGEEIFDFLVNFADDYVAKLLFSRYIDTSTLEHFRVVDGWSGVSFAATDLRDEDNCVYIQVCYQISLPFVSTLLPKLTVTQTSSAGLFSGELAGIANEKDTEIVYVTKNGAVYHTSLLCTHLKLSTREILSSELDKQRNYKGGKYYACEYCARKKKKPEKLYITLEGDRYHYKSDCIGLRRTVTEKKLSEVTLPICSRCRERVEKAGTAENAEDKE